MEIHFTHQYMVADGPNKFDIMLSLFEGKTVEFSLKYVDDSAYRRYDDTVHIRINSLQAESGTRAIENWNFSGYLMDGPARERAGKSIVVEGYYHTRTRKGNLTFIE